MINVGFDEIINASELGYVFSAMPFIFVSDIYMFRIKLNHWKDQFHFNNLFGRKSHKCKTIKSTCQQGTLISLHT